MEHEQQAMVVKWFKLQFGEHSACIFAIPNGAILCDLDNWRRAQRMKYLAAEGFKKGVSDLFIAVPRKNYAGFFLEMKDENKTENNLTVEQRSHIREMRRAGYWADWAAGFDDAKKKVLAYMAGKPTGATAETHGARFVMRGRNTGILKT